MSRLCFFTNSWGSGEIRGRQIGEALGPDVAVVDPDNVGKDDIIVGVKAIPPNDVIERVKAVYVDVVDCHGTIETLKQDKRLNAIAIGDTAYDHLCSEISADRVVKIPEHHCNFERRLRSVDLPIKTVGYIGEMRGLHLVTSFIASALEGTDVELLICYQYTDRQSVVDFYSRVDMQLTYRIDDRDNGVYSSLKNPLKLANAGSFGIPTVGWPEANYLAEWKGCFWEAFSTADVVSIIKYMTPERYRDMSYRALGRAEYYHIDRILPLYLELLNR